LPAGTSGTLPPFSLDWDRALDAEGIQQVSDLKPGLYGLDKGTLDGDGCKLDADGSTAWVLIAPNVDFERLNGEWKTQAAAIAELDRSGAANATLLTIRHAVLSGLAESLRTR
jgi:hypothetical protein